MSKAKVAPPVQKPQASPPPLEQKIPITHHGVMAALSRAAAALDLFRLAEEHFEDGPVLEFARGICLDVIGDELEVAKVVYAKAVGDKTAVA